MTVGQVGKAASRDELRFAEVALAASILRRQGFVVTVRVTDEGYRITSENGVPNGGRHA